jgi:hypothetical protein
MKKPIDFTRPVPAIREPGAKLLKRSEAARLLGVSVSTLRRREGDLVQPVVDARGVHRFVESELRAVMVTVRHREAVERLGPSGGDVAAEVFTLLDEGAHPTEIVKRLRLVPDVVVALHEQWARMQGGFAVNRDDARSLALTAKTRQPATSGSELVEQIDARFVELLGLGGAPRCKYCGDPAACVCKHCILDVRGRLIAPNVKLESRTNDGTEELRVVATVARDELLEEGGYRPVTVFSDWFRRDLGERSPIVEFVEALEPRPA